MTVLYQQAETGSRNGKVTTYVLTELAKKELINDDYSINTELIETGIPQWKKDWYD